MYACAGRRIGPTHDRSKRSHGSRHVGRVAGQSSYCNREEIAQIDRITTDSECEQQRRDKDGK